MPRYFFDFYDGSEVSDTVGTFLRDTSQAKIEASKFAVALLGDDPKSVWGGQEWAVRVRDEKGIRILQLTFLSCEISSSPE